MRRLITTILAFILLMTAALGAAEESEPAYNYFYELGDPIENFTVTTYDGREVELYDLIANNDMVLINLWATWCGPCRNEFPFMQEAYLEYQDKIAIVALSCEETDDDETLKAFAEELGLTFDITGDTAELSERFQVEGIPTSVVVDRYGIICFIESGSLPDADSFRRLFDTFVGDDYEQTILYDLPKAKPNIESSTEAEICEALNVRGGQLVFENSGDEYDWPMPVTEIDGRNAVKSSNTGVNDSVSRFFVTIPAKEGDAMRVIFKLSSESGCDVMRIEVDGEVVKTFGGEKDWMSYTYVFESEKDHLVAISYEKDVFDSFGEDALWVDSVEYLSGDIINDALSENPVYPISDEIYVRIVNDSAKRIIIDDPTGLIDYYYGGEFYIIGDDEAVFEFGLTENVDPEAALVYFNYDGSAVALAELIKDGVYTASCAGDSVEVTGYPDSSVYLYLEDDIVTATYFLSEENANAFVEEYTSDDDGNALGKWMYEDGTLPASDELPKETAQSLTEAVFLIKYVDQNGDPVQGAVCQVCDDSTCVLYTSDENGTIEFTLEPYPWEIHTLMLPQGYEGDTETVTVSSLYGGEYEFTVTKK